MSVRFSFEWEAAPGVKDPLLAATWARLEIRIAGHCPTRLLDHAAKSEREAVWGSLWPLAEWVVQNWWFVFSEERKSAVLSARETTTPAEKGWMRRHNLMAAQSAGALPDMIWARSGPKMMAAWSRDREARATRGLTFLSEGYEELPLESVQRAFHGFVRAVLARTETLHDPVVDGLRADWEAIDSTSDGDLAVCTRAARAGIDPFDSQALSPGVATLLRSPGVREPLLDDLLDAVSPEDDLHPTEIEDAIRQLKASVEAAAFELPHKAPLLPPGLISNPKPFEDGYRSARWVRSEVLKIAEDVPVAETLLRTGMPFQLNEAQPSTLGPQSLRGLVGWQGDSKALLLPSITSKASASRFLRARGLYGLLSGRCHEAPQALSRAQSRGQAAGRAFAAELLAPAEALGARFKGLTSWNEINEAAAAFGVSPLVIEHQLLNHGIARVVSDE